MSREKIHNCRFHRGPLTWNMRGSFLFGAILLVALAGSIRTAAQTGAAVQITPADYARAEALDPKNLLDKLKNGLVLPHWIGRGDEFWYRRDTAAGHEFTLVDAASGRKRPAFDHQALARALAPALGANLSPDNLPFDSFTFDNAARDVIHFSTKENAYDCHLTPAVRCDTLPARTDPQGMLVSPDGRWGVLTRSGNLWLHEMATGLERALTSDGGPDFGYGIYTDGWKAAYIPRERAESAGLRLPPLESFWLADSRTVVVIHVDSLLPVIRGVMLADSSCRCSVLWFIVGIIGFGV